MKKPKILLVSPKTGGIDVYINVLKKALTELEVNFETFSSEVIAYNVEEKKWKDAEVFESELKEEIRKIDWMSYDLIAYHYGKNDVEQLIPVLLEDQGIKVKKDIYFVHFLSWNLFSQFVSDPIRYKKVNKRTSEFKHLVFYGNAPKDFWLNNIGKPEDYILSYYPEAHSHIKVNETDLIAFNEKFKIKDSDLPTIIWPGFPSNYKDHDLLLNSLKYIEQPIRVIFAGQGWSKRIGEPEEINGSKVEVVDSYLSALEFKLAVEHSLFGVLLYKNPEIKDEFFQGSGTLPNFIALGKPTVVLNEGLLGEYVDKAGIVIEEHDPKILAKAIDKLTDTSTNKKLAENANMRRYLFSPNLHASTFIGYINSLLK